MQPRQKEIICQAQKQLFGSTKTPLHVRRQNGVKEIFSCNQINVGRLHVDHSS